MKKAMTRAARRPGSVRAAEQKLSVPIAVSFIGHLVFCLLIILLPKFSPSTKMPSHFINVQLVSPSVALPDAAQAPKEETPAAETPAPKASTPPPVAEAAPKAKVSTAQKSKDAVSLAPKTAEKLQSMKRMTFKRERVMESAIKNVEKRVESSKTDQKQQALDRIRADLREKEAQETSADSGTANSSADLGRKGVPTSDIQRIYSAEVTIHIQKNWAFSEQMAGGEKNLYNEVVIKIARNGNIVDIWFDRRSGNSYFDDSTYKAILKSSPLPPIPDEISGSSMTLGFRFIPEGIK